MQGNFVRGIRNNNPFNIKRSRHPWLGKVDFKNTFTSTKDPVFEQFVSMEFGVRAGLKLLLNYVFKGLDTPAKIIGRFAPTTENNTSNYIDFITRNARGLHFIQPDERIGDIQTLCYMASRMVKYECNLTICELCNFMLTPEDMERVINKFNLNDKGIL